MNIDIAGAIIDQLHNMDIEADIREDYSGRGMYGTTTAGIVTDANMVVVGYCAGVAETDIDFWEVEQFRTDSMGLSTIIY